MKRVVASLFGLLVLVALLLAPRLTVDNPYLLHMLVLMCVYAIPAVGLNLMLGYSGLVSLGHMGFAGLGAYTAAVLMVDARWSFWSALGAATVAAGLAGVVIGVICFRFRGHFFMIVTLAFGLLLHAVMNNWDAVTRGAAGFAGIPRPRPMAWGDELITFGQLPNFYYLALALALLVFGVQYLVVRSNLGRILSAIRQDERLARSRGVNVLMYKTVVFALGTALAGLGGVLHVSFLRVAAPASFNMLESINTVLIVIIGGAGSLMGPALGALLYVGLPEWLRLANEWRLVIFGGLLVLITLFAPAGLAGLLARLWARMGAQRQGRS
ncbi:MAG: branched-chain amino acid ABC transporter permease [Comamonadaceae bacterium]|jgi:branched-chain amino acid transport system permease protein|nr:branched-chain amino acid ABC transporter permease [Comamonadaceae bacterium]